MLISMRIVVIQVVLNKIFYMICNIGDVNKLHEQRDAVWYGLSIFCVVSTSEKAKHKLSRFH